MSTTMPATREAGSLAPAFKTPGTSDASTAGLPIFTPVQGNVDTGVTHSGDLGGAGSR